MDELQGKETEVEEEEDVPLKRLRNKARNVPVSNSIGSGQAEEDEQKEGEAAERRRRSLRASVAQRERKVEEKRSIEVGKKGVQERRSEKGGGAKETGEGKKLQEEDKAPRVVRTKEKGTIGEGREKEGGEGEEEVRKNGSKGVKVETGKRRVECGESSQLREEVEEGQDDDLLVNSTWDVRFERMFLSEFVEDGEDGMKEVGEDLDTVGKGLQAELKGSTELFTQGFFYYIQGFLKEMSRLRKKEEERDAQVAKLIEDVEGMKKEVEELKKGKEELQKQMSTLRVSLTMKDKELENEADARGRVEKKVKGLSSEVSVQGQDLDAEISERKKLGQDWEKRWGEILKGMGKLKLSHQGKERETTKMVERKEGGEKRVQTKERKEESPAPKREVSESMAMPLPREGKRQRVSELGSSEGVEDRAKTSTQPDIKKIRPSMAENWCFFCTKEGHLRDDCSILALYIKEGKVKYDNQKRLVAYTRQIIRRIPEEGRVALHRILGLPIDF
ncbi:hypothetical protein CBR_g4533 [Chara braunii]|uniref:CCHC-type domain-containing protein n=1 Tax=Chara braunii TaxID=69332 RepID=A0A388KI28_CHABU|nr:hypothetical protein CBR_g4533 [Chara braunii]|eukprot:GBG69701.1 hypothetical protein CBR_g4533 [Chara braunii]